MAASTKEPPAVLVVDEDPDLRRLLTLALAGESYDVRAAANERAAMQLPELMDARPCPDRVVGP